MWVTPITDRTATQGKTHIDLGAEDLNLLSQDGKYLFAIYTGKPMLNFGDLNRIELDCAYLAEQFNANLVPVTITTKTDWTAADFPYLAQINRIRDNVNALKNAYYAIEGSPDITYWNSLNWQDANILEQNLKNLKTLLDLMIASFKYSGTFSAGQEVIL